MTSDRGGGSLEYKLTLFQIHFVDCTLSDHACMILLGGVHTGLGLNPGLAQFLFTPKPMAGLT
jgi:hypothetical protein